MSSDEYSTMHPKHHYKYQPVAQLNQDPPVQNTWYTALDANGGLRIRILGVRQINDEAAAKNIEFRMTIDGVSIDASVRLQTSPTWYYWTLGPGVERVSGGTFIVMAQLYEAIECLDALIEIRMTSAPGTNQFLDGRIHYESYDRVQS